MNTDSIPFLLRRLREETNMVELAGCDQARKIHGMTATRYADRAMHQIHNADDAGAALTA